MVFKGQTHEFLNVHGAVVVKIEERTENIFAVVGDSRFKGRKLQLSVPQNGTDGAARAVCGTNIGACHTEAGIRATRKFLVALNNRGIAVTRVLHGYFITTVVL